jgi:hypothetical protein
MQLIIALIVLVISGFVSGLIYYWRKHKTNFAIARKEIAKLNEVKELPRILPSDELLHDFVVYFERQYTLLKYKNGQEAFGTFYLTSNSLVFVCNIIKVVPYDSIGKIEFSNRLFSNVRLTVKPKDGESYCFLVPGATIELLQEYLKRLFDEHTQTAQGGVSGALVNNECPFCKVPLRAGRCEYCRWQAPTGSDTNSGSPQAKLS